MAAILFSKISPKIFKRKHFKLIVHWKPLKPILSEIETLLQKKNVCGSWQLLQKKHNQWEQSNQIWAMTTPNTNEHILKIWLIYIQ